MNRAIGLLIVLATIAIFCALIVAELEMFLRQSRTDRVVILIGWTVAAACAYVLGYEARRHDWRVR